jgi:hypothetical protein
MKTPAGAKLEELFQRKRQTEDPSRQMGTMSWKKLAGRYKGPELLHTCAPVRAEKSLAAAAAAAAAGCCARKAAAAAAGPEGASVTACARGCGCSSEVQPSSLPSRLLRPVGTVAPIAESPSKEQQQHVSSLSQAAHSTPLSDTRADRGASAVTEHLRGAVKQAGPSGQSMAAEENTLDSHSYTRTPSRGLFLKQMRARSSTRCLPLLTLVAFPLPLPVPLGPPLPPASLPAMLSLTLHPSHKRTSDLQLSPVFTS